MVIVLMLQKQGYEGVGRVFRVFPSQGQNGQLSYTPPADESSMWGASVGIGMTEWAQFLDVVARPEGEQQGH